MADMRDETNSIKILEKMENNDKFIETNFEQYPFKDELSILYDQIIEKINIQDKKIFEDKELNINSIDYSFIYFEYYKKNYKIYNQLFSSFFMIKIMLSRYTDLIHYMKFYQN